VLLTVINQGNAMVVSFHAIYGHSHPDIRGDRLRDGDAINSLPITRKVKKLERSATAPPLDSWSYE
jgi:hypothetical protein